MYLPDVNFFVPKEPAAYTDKDMWVGNELVINKHRFRLVAADEYALRYMELHSEQVSPVDPVDIPFVLKLFIHIFLCVRLSIHKCIRCLSSSAAFSCPLFKIGLFLENGLVYFISGYKIR